MVARHKRDALWPEPFAADREQPLARIRGNPGVHTVGNDVIEIAQFRTDGAKVRRLQGDVRQPQGIHHFASGGNHLVRQIHSREAAFGQRVRHGNQVVPIAAADFEYAATMNRGGIHAEKFRQGSETVRMGLAPRKRGVRYMVVRIVLHDPYYGRCADCRGPESALVQAGSRACR